MRSKRGSAVALGLTVLWVLVMLVPAPRFNWWMVRLVARETALGAVVLGLVAVGLSRGRRRLVAVAATVVASLPITATLPGFVRAGVWPSPAAYLGLAATPAVAVDRDVPLDPARPELLVDVYRPEGAGPHPFVVVVHGGSWLHGDKGEAAHVSRRLAAAGFAVFDLRYRLSPTHRFPASVGDVKCALGRLREAAARWQLDPARGALLGRSAGGQLVLLAGWSAGDGTLPPSCAVVDTPPARVVALYPFSDLAGAWDHPPRPDPEETRDVLETHFGGPPDGARRADYLRADPAAHRGDQPPPTLLVHGAADQIVPVEHSRRLDRPPVVTEIIPFADHAFDQRPGGAADQLSTAVILRFLAAPGR